MASIQQNSTEEGKVSGGKYLTFFLHEEEYGIEILKVKEIIGVLPITRVPRTPAFIRGVINLRGKIIPVMDLPTKLGMTPGPVTPETCIIVVHSAGIEMGVIVDRVSEVVVIPRNQIEDAPFFGSQVHTEFISGIGKVGQRVKILLEVERILSDKEMAQMADVQEGSTNGEGS